MKYHLVSVLLIAAAIPLYVVGFSVGGSVVLAAAIALEVWFWVRVVRGKPRLNAANDVH
jgi:uncharacterized membrane protein